MSDIAVSHTDVKPDEFDIVRELNRLETLRDPAAERVSTSKREAQRYPIREEARLFPMSRSTLEDDGQTVFLRDIGRGGVGFLSDRPLVNGRDFRIVFHRSGYAVAESAISVRFSRPVRPGLFLVGASFVASAGLLTTLGIEPARLEAEYRRESFDAYAKQNAA